MKRMQMGVVATALAVAFVGCTSSESAGEEKLPKESVWAWGYVLDKTPSACPFRFGKTSTSLETALGQLGADRAIYMNSMFDRDYILKWFPKWDRECFENCIDTRLSAHHFELLKDAREIWCTLEHGDVWESALRIARLSLVQRRIAGINVDDFNWGGEESDAMTPERMKKLRDAIRAVNPALKIAVVTYADDDMTFDVSPYRDVIDVASRWKYKTDPGYWDRFAADTAKLRSEVGPHVKIIQGLYLHDFGKGLDSRDPVPLDYFKKSVRACAAAVRAGTLDGVILPQGSWYDSPRHRAHVDWLLSVVR